jgi:GTP-dependent phosphoenolpyruvate carboxykinase
MTKNQKLIKWVEDIAALTKPDRIHWCDGSAAENQAMCDLLVKAGTFKPLPKRPGSYAAIPTVRRGPQRRPHLHLQQAQRRRRPHQQLARSRPK